MKTVRISRIVHNGKQSYDHIELNNGSTIALQYHPFFSGDEAYEDIAVDRENDTLYGKAIIRRELTGKPGAMYEASVETNFAGEQKNAKYQLSESQFFHPQKDMVHRLVVKTMYGKGE